MALTLFQRWAECVVKTEALRLEHNSTGKEFIAGLITEKAWNDYKKLDWRPRMDLAQDAEDDSYYALRMDVINGN